MKKDWLWVTVFVMVCLGCGKPNDNRIVDLEKRMAALEGRLAMAERQMLARGKWMGPRRSDGKGTGVVSRGAPLASGQIAERQRLREDVRKRLEERRDKARAKKQSGEGTKKPEKEPAEE